MRIACVWAPQLALQAVLRRDPERRGDAIALADGAGARARIVGFTEAASRAGVRRGWTVAQARAVGGEALSVIPHSAVDTAAAAAALCDVGYGLAPRIDSESARIFFEVGGLAALYPAGDQAVAQAIAMQTARLGLAVRVGIAEGKGLARIAAQTGDLIVVRGGEERSFLAGVTLRSALAAQTSGPLAEAGPALETTLARWGVRTLGALAALPREEVVLRLGAVGAALHRIACGHDDEPFAPQLAPDALEEGTELDYAVHELEPLAFLLRGLLDRALERLACRGLACAGLTLRLVLDPRGFDVREVPLAAPTREVATVLQLLRLDLARRPPPAPVVGATVLVLPAGVRAQQLDFWRPAGPAPERLAATLARLAALVGSENVGSPATVDTYREEAVEVRSYAAEEPARRGGATSPPSPRAARLAFRRFRPPQPLDVLLGRDGPSALHGRNTTARVLVAAGPYRVGGAWWSDEGWSRDYWDVQASDGAVYRVHQDRCDGAWYLDGYYD